MRPETEGAIRAALISQGIADSRRGAGEITSKGGIDLVTATDVACEDAIRVELTRSFPEYPIIGEERGGARVDGKPVAQEAGALVTDLDNGKPWNLESRSFLLAATPSLHQDLQLLANLQQ